MRMPIRPSKEDIDNENKLKYEQERRELWKAVYIAYINRGEKDFSIPIEVADHAVQKFDERFKENKV